MLLKVVDVDLHQLLHHHIPDLKTTKLLSQSKPQKSESSNRRAVYKQGTLDTGLVKV